MSNMFSMSDDASLEGQEQLTLPQDMSYPPFLWRVRIDLSV
jgi:hypothetical protein